MAGIAGKVSHASYMGKGGTKAGHRTVKCEARTVALRSLNRATRYEGRALCRTYVEDEPESPWAGLLVQVLRDLSDAGYDLPGDLTGL